jgi:serine/threonine protein kinase
VPSLGPWILGALIEEGEARVYRVTHARTGRRAIAKRIPRLARHEETALRRIRHVNVARLFDSGDTEEDSYLILEDPGDDDLHRELSRGRMPLARAVAIIREVLAGLAAAHGAHVVHGDLSAANIRVPPPGGFVKIVDFANASLDRSPPPAELLLGNPVYTAPERIKNGQLDARADLYSVGCLLYEMVSGRRPFDGPSLIMQHLAETPPPPPVLAKLIMRLLAKDPAARPQSCAEVIAELDELVPPVVPTIADAKIALGDEETFESAPGIFEAWTTDDCTHVAMSLHDRRTAPLARRAALHALHELRPPALFVTVDDPPRVVANGEWIVFTTRSPDLPPVVGKHPPAAAHALLRVVEEASWWLAERYVDFTGFTIDHVCARLDSPAAFAVVLGPPDDLPDQQQDLSDLIRLGSGTAPHDGEDEDAWLDAAERLTLPLRGQGRSTR